MSTIDDYLQGLPDDRRAAFEQMCAVVRRAVPDAEEGKSYGLPAFRWNGRPLLGFRAFKDHLSVMPFSAEVVAAVADRLEGFPPLEGQRAVLAGPADPRGGAARDGPPAADRAV